MSWSQNPNEAPDSPATFYTSSAVKEMDLRADFRVLFDEVLRRRDKDGVPEDAQVLFEINSVNSYVDVSWLNAQLAPAGSWTYTAWLNSLGEACLTLEDGADEFVRITRFAIHDMVYDYYFDRYGAEFETMVCQPLCYCLVPEHDDAPRAIVM